MASKAYTKPVVAEDSEQPAKKSRTRYATSEQTKLVEHPGAVTAPETPAPEIVVVTFQIVGDMTVGSAGGLSGALGGKETVPVVRDPRDGRLYKLVAL